MSHLDKIVSTKAFVNNELNNIVIRRFALLCIVKWIFDVDSNFQSFPGRIGARIS